MNITRNILTYTSANLKDGEISITVDLVHQGKRRTPYLVLAATPTLEGYNHLSTGCPNADDMSEVELQQLAFRLIISFFHSVYLSAAAH